MMSAKFVLPLQLLLATVAAADVVDILTVDKTDIPAQELGFAVCQVVVQFDDANDVLTAMVDVDVFTNDPQGFHQHPLGQDTEPLQSLVALHPDLAYDSFVTLGAQTSTGSPSTTPLIDTVLFNNAGQLVGGWSTLDNPSQAVPDENQQVLGAQLTVRQGFNVVGSLTATYNNGGGSFTATIECYSQPCVVDSDCADTNPCTDNACIENSCVNTLLDCDDGDPFTVDMCVDGVCRNTPQVCGQVNASCCVGTGTPGCEDFDCCSSVCRQVPSCCESAWGARCKALAIQICPACEQSGPTGLLVTDTTSEAAAAAGLRTCQLEVAFGAMGDNLLLISSDGLTTSAPDGFFQSPFGLDTAPPAVLIELFPELLYDSFVTIGVAIDEGADATSLALFDSALFNTGGAVEGDWYNANPPNGQGIAGPDLKVLAAQFTVGRQYQVGGDVFIFANDGLQSFPAAFDCIVDCNGNGVHDEDDIANGTSLDADPDGIPDECLVDVPTVSEWGLVLITLLMLTAGTLVFGRQARNRCSPSEPR